MPCDSSRYKPLGNLGFNEASSGARNKTTEYSRGSTRSLAEGVGQSSAPAYTHEINDLDKATAGAV